MYYIYIYTLCIKYIVFNVLYSYTMYLIVFGSMTWLLHR